MANLSNTHSLYPIQYHLGQSSQRIIIHNQNDLNISHEHLFQDDTPTRFYHYKANTFLFVLKGELYLKQDEQDRVIKQHQGVWLEANTVNIVTLLKASIEICLIRFKASDQSKSLDNLKKVSSGTVNFVSGRNGIKTWPLWQGDSGYIAIELYPPYYKETLYYQKAANQYLQPLNGQVFINNGKGTPQACPEIGKIITTRTPRAILNPNTESVTTLTVTTSPAEKGRVLVLTRANK
ncbi:hypothetical protein [Marinomonas transparens]|uniref:Cupin domain-containing protein n=1 Tax=Marinomonas transparens TaxID=2795388 RepID=A0A934N0E2_9GAMM|nr:hypothetical protein [Marinomonas transparens]MBJ7538480.1 hypothetical protein [Marinomonas transparens]